MEKRFEIIREGQLFILEYGSYSDAGSVGVFRALKDFDIEKEAVSFADSTPWTPWKRNLGVFSPAKFSRHKHLGVWALAEHLEKRGLCESLDVTHVHEDELPEQKSVEWSDSIEPGYPWGAVR